MLVTITYLEAETKKMDEIEMGFGWGGKPSASAAC